jgi:hypothetical protein
VLLSITFGIFIPYNTYGGLYLFTKGFITIYSIMLAVWYLPDYDSPIFSKQEMEAYK